MKRNKAWWRVFGHIFPTLLTQSSDTRASYDESFRSFIAPLLDPTPNKNTSSSHISLICDDNTPVEIGWVFESISEMFGQYAIETLPASDGSPIPTPQSFSTLPLGCTLAAIQETVDPIPYLKAATVAMDTIEDPSRTALYSQQTDPSVINTSPPPAVDLRDSLRVADMSVVESVSNLRTYIHSPLLIAVARNLRGEEAQEFIELIDQVGYTWF